MVIDKLRFSLILLLILPTAWGFKMMKSPLRARARMVSSCQLCEKLFTGIPPTSAGRTRVFINNLPLGLEESDLNDVITKYLGASFAPVALCRDKVTGLSRGFALAHFECKEDADTAATALSTLVVHERTVSAHASDFTDATRATKPYPQETTCFIGNLAFTTKEADIKTFCSHRIGESAVKRVKLIVNPDSG